MYTTKQKQKQIIITIDSYIGQLILYCNASWSQYATFLFTRKELRWEGCDMSAGQYKIIYSTEEYRILKFNTVQCNAVK